MHVSEWQFANLNDEEIKSLKDLETQFNKSCGNDGVYFIALKK